MRMRQSRHGVLRTAVCAIALVGAVAGAAVAEDGWQLPADLSPADHVTAYPQLAIDSHGNQVVVWDEIVTGTRYAAMAAVWSGSTRRWGPATALSSTPANVFGPVVAIDAAGDALAAWSANGSSIPKGSAVQLAAKPAGADWQPAVNRSPPGEFAGAGRRFEQRRNVRADFRRLSHRALIADDALHPRAPSQVPSRLALAFT